VIEWLPAVKDEVERVASALPFNVPVPSVAAPSKKVTVPAGVPDAPDVTATVNVTEAPKGDGLSEDWSSVFVAGALTERLTVVVPSKLPDVPVIVTVTVPVGAAALAVSDNVLMLVAGFGLKAAVTPAGRPEAERVTLPMKECSGVMVIVLVPAAPPGLMVTEYSEDESEKANPVCSL